MDAAQWELEGPLMTGPITSLKMLGKFDPIGNPFSL
jgi:hypothetical protein